MGEVPLNKVNFEKFSRLKKRKSGRGAQNFSKFILLQKDNIKDSEGRKPDHIVKNATD